MIDEDNDFLKSDKLTFKHIIYILIIILILICITNNPATKYIKTTSKPLTLQSAIENKLNGYTALNGDTIIFTNSRINCTPFNINESHRCTLSLDGYETDEWNDERYYLILRDYTTKIKHYILYTKLWDGTTRLFVDIRE